MAHTDAEARRELLDTVAEATDALGLALAALGEAYEQLDEAAGDRLESELFRPVQGAYARASQTHAGFARRAGLDSRGFEQPSAGVRSQGAKGFVDLAVGEISRADATLAILQDSMAPVEYGDQELRAGLSGVREILGPLPGRARELLRVVGR